jgi:hypothetical protein
MKKGDLVKTALWAIAAAKKGERFEDSYVEFKAQLPEPEDAARQLAGLANAVRDEQFVVIVGVDEHGRVWGADNVELASWIPKVKKQFDGPAPRLIKNVNFPTDGKTVTALCFGCSDSPYMFREGDDRDIPWREGNRTRSATREEVFALFSEAEDGVKLPTVDVLGKHLWPQFDSDGKLSTLRLDVGLYVKTKGSTPVVFPKHDCRVSVIKSRHRYKFGNVLLIRNKMESGVVPADIDFAKPGALHLMAFAESPSAFPEGPVTVEISLLPVNAPSPVKLKFRMNVDLPHPPPQSKPEKRKRDPWRPTPFQTT